MLVVVAVVVRGGVGGALLLLFEEHQLEMCTSAGAAWQREGKL